MGVLTREQERAIFAKDRPDFASIRSQQHLLHMREGSVPNTNPHAIKRFNNFFNARKIQAIENSNTKTAQKNMEKEERKRDQQKIAHEGKVIEEQINLRRLLQSGKISRADYDEKISKLRKENAGMHISSKPVLPKDQYKKNEEQAKRDFEKIRHPVAIFPSGSGYQTYNPKTKEFDSKLTYEEQKAYGVDRPTMTVPIKEGHGEYYNIEVPVIPRAELQQEQNAKKEDATRKAEEKIKKDEEKQGYIDVGNMTPSQRLALLAIKPEALR